MTTQKKSRSITLRDEPPSSDPIVLALGAPSTDVQLVRARYFIDEIQDVFERSIDRGMPEEEAIVAVFGWVCGLLYVEGKTADEIAEMARKLVIAGTKLVEPEKP